MIKPKEVNDAIVDFCTEIIKNPLCYFNESDLHSLLIEFLYKANSSLKNIDYDTKLLSNKTNMKYKTRLVHREYGAGGRRAYDLVILKPSEIQMIKNPNLTYKAKNDYLKPLFAFELGTEKIGLEFDEYEKHITSDLNKLERCQDTGYIIHIVRDFNRQKRDRKKEKIEMFMDTIKNHNKGLNPKIKVIAIVLYLFRKNNEKYCSILKKDMWEEFEIDEQDDIMSCLKMQLISDDL